MPGKVLTEVSQPIQVVNTTATNDQPDTQGSQSDVSSITTTPIDSVDGLFDGIVEQERQIGIMVDLCSFDQIMVKPLVNGKFYEASDEYDAAMYRRFARLLNNEPSRDRLHWHSENFSMFTRRTSIGTKSVRCMVIIIPITAAATCDCGCGERDFECVMYRKELTVVCIFDLTPRDEPLEPPARADVHHSRQARGRSILNHNVTNDDSYAMIRARWRAEEVDWIWAGQNDLDLNALWLHVYDSFISIAADTDRLCTLRALARAARGQSALGDTDDEYTDDEYSDDEYSDEFSDEQSSDDEFSDDGSSDPDPDSVDSVSVHSI